MWCRVMLLLALAPVVMGQVELSRSTIEGYVRDHRHRPVPGIVVIAMSNADRQTTKTDKHGHYIIFTATPGEFEISVDQPGYASCYPPLVTVQAGYRYEVDVPADTACL